MEAKEKYQKAFKEYEDELKRKTEEANQKRQATIDSNNSSKYDELRELSKLKAEGLITIEEFDTKRKQMLGL
jgi:F0F1-type ATP synthase membrane subunit b/b'